ncbi:MAG: PIN domain-containing protein [Planctomycetales bacterium]|nr:PIN domain-containing protein [Planctomycetales bacterium]
MKSVIDASTVLAVCRQEPGANEARYKMRHGLITTVNLSEVFQKSMEHGKLPLAQAIIQTAGLNVVEFNEELALRAAELAAQTKKHAMSLADRACLALGITEQLPVITGDRKWLELSVGVKVEMFRPGVN